MDEARSKARPNWLNPKILAWARKWRGRSIHEVAAKLKQTPERIRAWELGDDQPTVRQARLLAEFYDRPFVEFFLAEPPRLPTPSRIADFRTHVGGEAPAEQWEVQEAQRWADAKRESFIFLSEELGYQVPQLPEKLFASLNKDPEEAARSVRAAMGFSIEEQLRLTRTEVASLPDLLRKSLEDIGVLVLRRTDLRRYGVRGMCLVHEPLPIIIYTTEAPTAQAFTIAHELGHVLTRQSSISGPRNRRSVLKAAERWCDKFAGAFLMPREQVFEVVGKPPSAPADKIEDDELRAYANIFRVSPHAMLIRLVDLGYVRSGYYWVVKFPRFREEEEDYHGFGRAPYYGTRYRNAVGEGYTRLVVEAWTSGSITNHNAAEFMGIKNLTHLYDIRKALEA